MSKMNITAAPRQVAGQAALKQLRRDGFVPGIVYGGTGTINFPVQFEAKELASILARGSESAFFTLTLADGSEHLVLPREIQYGAIRRDLRHVDLLIVDRDEAVRTVIPVRIVGHNEEPLQYGLLEIEVRGKPGDIPAGFEIDVTDFEVGHTVFVRDLDIPEEVELLSDLDEMVLGVVMASEEIVEEVEKDEDIEGMDEDAETDEEAEEQDPEALL